MTLLGLLKRVVPGGVKRRIRALVSDGSPAIRVSTPYEIRLVSVDRLKGQIAVVTGGSGVIGRSICCQLAAEGATVHVCGTSGERTNAVVSEITKQGGTAFAQILDISEEAAIVAAIAEIAARHGRIDILVNCAGGSARQDHSPIINQTTAVIDDILRINLRGTILCVREAARVMANSGYGRIINISSIIGDRGKADFAEYSAAKAGVIAFTKSIAMELGKFGITANCVSPGIVQRGDITEADLERLRKTNWLDSYGKPEDVATAVSYLVSEHASFVTGQNLVVDGGRSLGLKGD